MFNYQDIYHVGVRVKDIDEAMEEMGKGLGITWCEVQVREQQAWLPGKGAVTIPLKFTYSCEGPQHVELLQGAPGTIWDGSDVPGVHHMGIWVDSVKETTERLIGEGWSLEIAQVSPEDGYGSFSYVRSPSGFLLEPVTRAALPNFERWWAGGSL